MKLLLDTHAFIWWNDDYKNLPDKVFDAIGDPQNEIYLSLASVWEMQIKLQLGKLKFEPSLDETIQRHTSKNGLKLLSITRHDIFAISHLPMHHRDPFDRLLIAQARNNDLVFISHDSEIRKYEVEIFWD